MLSSMCAKTRVRAKAAAFTLVELLLVMVVILILVGIVIALAGPAQTRAARARATAEIEALRNGLERYKVDNAVYPSAGATDNLDPRVSSNPDNYKAASQALYAMLTAQPINAGTPAYPPPASPAGAKIYFEFKPTMLGGRSSTGAFPNGVSAINDPWGYSYGYSTAYQAALDGGNNSPSVGYGPGYDLWSVAGKSGSARAQWIKTW